jgi:uroporphyrinogen decarboxylase
MNKKNKPNFENILAILNGKIPERQTLFEFAINMPLCEKLAGDVPVSGTDELYPFLVNIYAFRNAGYDFCTILLPDFSFPTGNIDKKETKSLNERALIHDRKSFEEYNWPDPEKVDYSLLERLTPYMPDNMKLIVFSPDGVLENAIELMGFDALCMMLYDQPDLVQDVFTQIGSRLITYYDKCIQHEVIGAVFGNDDWGFKNSTILSPAHLQEFVFPWYKKIVSIAHQAGKPAILHSCGKIEAVMNDVINDMQFDGKHSFEDNIQPVEQAYMQYYDQIAIVGGIDVDFICRSSSEEVYKRSKRMIEQTKEKGRYALGSGNSIPEYVPEENYFAMLQAALEER